MKIRLDELDKLTSEYARRRAMNRVHGCERCRAWKADWKQLQCCHFHSRRKRPTRHNPDNLAGLCAGCHIYLDGNPIEKVEWFRERLGDTDFEMLNIQARMVGVKTDVAGITLYLKKLIEEVKDGYC